MKKLSDLIIRKKPKKNGFCTFEEYCDINGINIDTKSIRGAIVDLNGAIELSKLLGIKIKF